MNARFIDWIWHVRGSLPLAPGQSREDAFDRLTPLFFESGTSHERGGDTLTFTKRDQAAQDRMSVFDGGTLRIENGAGGSVLRWHMTSRALLFCFLAPLLFLAFGQLTIALGKLEKPAAEASEKKDEKKDKAAPAMNPIDKFLGAPAPEKPKKDSPKKEGKDKKEEKKDDKHSPTSAYVFAGIFAALYVGGRVLEDRKIKALIRRKLAGA
ncbi:hypothetical protein QUC32_00200 [Novosphingobium resinovorum]|uniref:hypothetical protein n=1 Tax=Novosphingobium TaxID=165696 RepID=UPI001B3C556E|nr:MULTISPECIES: hypothetical protein [Novosphingobium]MBF7013260.1 hypothetical protein [Novosphingobium sp. HR1a]WJM25413.1 hypothetical protein QUC32_00200 [Novosphingobium resinovorum]